MTKQRFGKRQSILPAGVQIGDGITVHMTPIACPRCQRTLFDRDVERLPDGFRLVCCKCGTDIQRIFEAPPREVND